MAAKDEPHGTVETVGQLAGDVVLLVRKELELAREEMAGKAKSAGIGAGMLSGSAVGGLFAIASLTGLVIVALALVMPLWASMLIVTVVWTAVAAVLGLAGRNKVKEAAPFVPEQTIASVKEDVEWTRNQKRVR